jgi:hypothetical protein
LEGIAAITEEWFRRVTEGYPEQMAQFLLAQPDPFRNPVGATFRRALPVLVRQAVGEETASQEVRVALDALLRIRAVQDLTAREAVGFIFLLREALGARGAADGVQRRIDELALAAFEIYAECREQIAQIRARESVRMRMAR